MQPVGKQMQAAKQALQEEAKKLMEQTRTELQEVFKGTRSGCS